LQRIIFLFTYPKIEYVRLAYVRILQKIEYVRYVTSSLACNLHDKSINRNLTSSLPSFGYINEQRWILQHRFVTHYCTVLLTQCLNNIVYDFKAMLLGYVHVNA